MSEDEDISGGNIDIDPTSMFDLEELCTQFDKVSSIQPIDEDDVLRDLSDIFGDESYAAEYEFEKDNK